MILDALAALIDYPRGDVERDARACATELGRTHPAAAAEIAAFADAIAGTPLPELEERYTETFDLTPTCSLDVGWHLFGDAHDRGSFMADVRERLEQAGVVRTAELPDHLTHVLRLLGREPSASAARLAVDIRPAIDRVCAALAHRKSPYAHVLDAVRTVVAAMAVEEREGTRS